MRYLLVGASGLLGSGFQQVLDVRGVQWHGARLPWGNPKTVATELLEQVQTLLLAGDDEPLALVWAAGTGRISAGSAEMQVETETVREVCDQLRLGTLPGEISALLFASSAGAVFGGYGHQRVRENDPPNPITAYGHEKLEQEAAFAGLHGHVCPQVILCRYSNLFGLASGTLRPKGLVSVVLRAAITNQAIGVFVSPDTRRDYLFNCDAARLSLSLMDAQATVEPAVEIVRYGGTMSVAEIVAQTARIVGKRVPVVFRDSPEAAVQPRMLDFGPRQGRQAAVPTTPFPAALRLMAEAPQAG